MEDHDHMSDRPHRHHRLPSRVRSNKVVDPTTTDQRPVDGVTTSLPSGEIPLLITPDLIQELVQNGSVAGHFRELDAYKEGIGWQSRRHVALEIEVDPGAHPMATIASVFDHP
jgi:hypothetical protein